VGPQQLVANGSSARMTACLRKSRSRMMGAQSVDGPRYASSRQVASGNLLVEACYADRRRRS
jgi:hypothetical protein